RRKLVFDEPVQIRAFPFRFQEQLVRARERRQSSVESLDEILSGATRTPGLMDHALYDRERVLHSMRQFAEEQTLARFQRLGLCDVARAFQHIAVIADIYQFQMGLERERSPVSCR